MRSQVITLLSRSPSASMKGKGFTLTELMIVLIILAVLLTLAAPSFKSLVVTQRVKSAISDLQASLFLARSEAIKRAALVSVVPNSSDWKNGWVICVDANGNSACDTGEVVIERRLPLSIGVASISGSGVTFRRDGRLSAGAATIKASASGVSGVVERCVVIDLSGRPSVSSGDGCN